MTRSAEVRTTTSSTTPHLLTAEFVQRLNALGCQARFTDDIRAEESALRILSPNRPVTQQEKADLRRTVVKLEARMEAAAVDPACKWAWPIPGQWGCVTPRNPTEFAVAMAVNDVSLDKRMAMHAIPFLRALDGPTETRRPEDVVRLFQIFDNSESRQGGDKLPPRVLIGSLKQLAEQLDRLNRDGMGIHFLVNDNGLNYRHGRDSIIAVRAYYADADTEKAHVEPPDWDRDLPLAPDVVVHSGHGYQVYWILPKPLALDGEADLDAYEARLNAIAIAMAPWGGDDAFTNANQVPRLPGFFNRKRPGRYGVFPMVTLLRGAEC